MMNYKEALEKAREQVNKGVALYNDKDVPLQFMSGDSQRWDDDKIFRSGSLSLDMAIGIGGIPRGRVTEFHGDFSSGKTTTALLTLAEAQRNGTPCVIIDAENALDPVYMKKLGVDLEGVLISQSSITEEAIKIIIESMNSIYEASGLDSLVVLDSIPTLMPMAAQNEKEGLAENARIWSKKAPKILEAMRNTGSTLITINQLRDSFGFGGGKTTPGGRAIKFLNSVQVEISRATEGKWWGKEVDGIDGQFMKYTIVKNKVGSPYKRGESYLPTGQPIDWMGDVFVNAVRYGVVIKDHKGSPLNGKVALEKKQTWYTFILTDDEVDYLNELVREEAAKDGVEVDDPYEYGHFITARHESVFKKKFLEEFEPILHLVEERVLQTLNTDLFDQSVDHYIYDENDEIEEVEESVESENSKEQEADISVDDPEGVVEETAEVDPEFSDEDLLDRLVEKGLIYSNIKGSDNEEGLIELEDKQNWFTYVFSPVEIEAVNDAIIEQAHELGAEPDEDDLYGIGAFFRFFRRGKFLEALENSDLTLEMVETRIATYDAESLEAAISSAIAD